MNKFIYYYLSLFYSLLIAVVISILILSQLHIKPAPIYGLADILPMYRSSFIPQSYKLVYYAVAILSITLISIILFLNISRFAQKYNKLKRYLFTPLSLLSIVILFLSYYFILYYGHLKINEYYYIFKLDPVIFHPYHIAAFLFGIIFFLCLYFDHRISPYLWRAFRVIYNYLPLITVILIAITLFDRIIDEKYFYIGYLEGYLHTAPFIGSINDVLMGKVMLVDASSQYGLFMPFLFALIFKVIPLSIPNFFYLMVIFGIIYYIFAYFLFKLTTKSNVWALIGVLVMFTLHFYSTFDRYTRPQVFPLRYLMDLPFFFLLLHFDNTGKKWLKLFLPFYAAFAIFYNLEVGSSIVISYLVYKSLRCLLHHPDKGLGIRILSIVKSTFTLIFYIFILGLVYSLYAKLISGQYPDWSSLWFYVRIFSQGFAGGNLPPSIGLHLLTLAIYLIVLIKSCLSYLYKWPERNLLWKISFVLYGLTIYVYYIKSPYILNLAIISIPAIILMINLFQELFNFYVKNRNSNTSSLSTLTILTPYLIFSSIVTFSITVYFARLIVNHNHPYWGRSEADRIPSEKIYNNIITASSYIRELEKSHKKIVILSYYDAIILIKSGKTNALPLSNSQLILTISQETNLLYNLKKLNPQKVYADTDTVSFSYHADRVLQDKLLPSIFDYLKKNYRRTGTHGLLDVWEKN